MTTEDKLLDILVYINELEDACSFEMERSGLSDCSAYGCEANDYRLGQLSMCQTIRLYVAKLAENNNET